MQSMRDRESTDIGHHTSASSERLGVKTDLNNSPVRNTIDGYGFERGRRRGQEAVKRDWQFPRKRKEPASTKSNPFAEFAQKVGIHQFASRIDSHMITPVLYSNHGQRGRANRLSNNLVSSSHTKAHGTWGGQGTL